jgi:hypothetical protein
MKTFSRTRWSFVPKCISDNRGVTLVEVAAVTFIIGAVMLGLAYVYLFGLVQWRQTVSKIHLQQAGTQAVEEIAKTLQAATLIQKGEKQITARTVVEDMHIDTFVVFINANGMLKKDQEVSVPFSGIEQYWVKGLTVEDFDLTLPAHPDSLYHLRLRVTYRAADFYEEMEFRTSFYPRNTVKTEQTEAPS